MSITTHLYLPYAITIFLHSMQTAIHQRHIYN